MIGTATDPFPAWIERLFEHHLEDLTFAEVRRGLQALSGLYVERRSRIPFGAAFDGRGKRAAFALFYGPLHFLIVRRIVLELGLAADPVPTTIVDLGCGTGACGAAWGLQCVPRPALRGIDRHAWAVTEASRAWAELGLAGRARRAGFDRTPLPGSSAGIVVGWTIDELDDQQRARTLEHLLDAGRRGARILVCEPIAHRPLPWWTGWERRFRDAGGRSDLWRLSDPLPERVRNLDRAAGLDHRELTARSLALA